MRAGMLSITLLIFSNLFMNLAWYGHLHLKSRSRWADLPILLVILLSWLVALAEYALQVPANRIGHVSSGGPFQLFQLKIIQEVLSLSVFLILALVVFKTESLRWNHLVGFGLMILAVYLVMLKP